MKNLKASMKLFMPHTFILALLVLGIIINFVSIINIRKQTEALYDRSFAIKNAAGAVNEALEAMQVSVYRAISNDSQDITNEAISDARNRAVILQEQITQLKQYILGDMDAFSRLETNLSELAQMQEHVLALAAQNNNSAASAYMENSNVPVINEVQGELTQFMQSAEANERKLMASLRQTQRNTINLLIVLGVLGILFSVNYFWRLHKELRQRSKQYYPAQMK